MKPKLHEYVVAIALVISVCMSLSISMAAADSESKTAVGSKQMLKTEDIYIRDPFILPVTEEKCYYMYGTTRAMGDSNRGPSFETYVSRDLKQWEGPYTVFDPTGTSFWGTRDFWAPEVHRYNGKYYLFGSFITDNKCRGTHILVSKSPRGPFKPLTDQPVTPQNWECLDGTLFVDEVGKPWIVFCHEWVQVHDGEICAMPLTADLKKPTTKPVLLFRASEALWPISISIDKKNYVTDGPFIHRLKNGQLIMLWSSFGPKGYAQSLARCESGKITGPWKQEPKPIFEEDGGHGMLFSTFEGELKLVLHTPNGGGRERARFFSVCEEDGKLVMR